MPNEPHGILEDLDSLQAYQQLADDLRTFEGVLMHHFFNKPDAEARQAFADAAGGTIAGFYQQYCKAIGQLAPDCGHGCWDGNTCVECFANPNEQAAQKAPVQAD